MSNLGKSIARLSVLVQSGALDPRALAEETLDAVSSHPEQAIFTTLTPERMHREADASARRLREGRSLGALDGIPIAWLRPSNRCLAITRNFCGECQDAA